MKIPFLNRKKEIQSPEQEGKIEILDMISPSLVEVGQNNIKIGDTLSKTYFIFSFPRYLTTGWMSPIINTNLPMDISFHIHPADSSTILKQLRRRVTEVQADLSERQEKGLIRDPALEIAYQDLEELRNKIQSAQERMFHLSIYITVFGKTEEKLKEVETEIRSVLESRLIYLKPALHQQKEGFICSSPYGLNTLMISNAMNTSPLSSTFPFTSFDLSSGDGILYGINKHNSSLVLFDRFSLPNANSCIFATSGSGKSYAVKLELLRYLMLGVDVIIIDPENEYKFLSDAIGGSFFNMSLSSPNHLNAFDLPKPGEGEDAESVLRTNVINLVGLIRLMLGGLTPEEDGIVDKALNETYAIKDITSESDPSLWGKELPFPVMSDFEDILLTMEGTESLVRRLQKFTKGAYANFFNNQSNVEINNRLVVFGTRDLEDELRPMALFTVLRYIWKTVTSIHKKRLLVVDEAWWLMKSEDSASFLFGTVKRARKYWLGVTTITQDVNDFLKSSYGQPIVTNSSLILLLKQSPATIDSVQDAFNLTEEEKMTLLETPVGEGIFFAGTKHALIRIIASYTEDQIITTSPEEVEKIRKSKKSS